VKYPTLASLPVNPRTGAPSSVNVAAYLSFIIKNASCFADAKDNTFNASLARDLLTALLYTGNAIATITAITITTTNNSVSVKPPRGLFFPLLLLFDSICLSFEIGYQTLLHFLPKENRGEGGLFNYYYPSS
jgi:hypothetical protein